MDMKERLKELIELVKCRSGMSQEQMAMKMKYSETYISDMLTPTGKVTEKFINKFEMYFKEYLQENTIKSSENPEGYSHTEKLISHLEATILQLREDKALLQERVKRLESEVQAKLDKVGVSLNVLSRNQASAYTLEVAIHREIVAAVSKTPEDAERSIHAAYREAAQMRLELEKKDNLFEVGI